MSNDEISLARSRVSRNSAQREEEAIEMAENVGTAEIAENVGAAEVAANVGAAKMAGVVEPP